MTTKLKDIADEISRENIIKNAVTFLQSAYARKATNLFLEEIKMPEDDKNWFVTISFSRPKPKSTNFDSLMSTGVENFERVYKKFEIDSKEGKVLEMSIVTF
ncbi:hypothetical protein H8D57_03350 [bacterium]|nr:hypothetical protein [bacterium]